jgi:hypothetical protein
MEKFILGRLIILKEEKENIKIKCMEDVQNLFIGLLKNMGGIIFQWKL